jgi:hypothetical protein
MHAIAPAGAKSATLSLVIIRADGSTQDLGVVSTWHKNPILRLAWRVKRFLKG